MGACASCSCSSNLQRQDLAPLDEARAYQELLDIQKCSPRQLAALLHISDQQVRLRLRLLSDQVLADAVERRQIAANTARLIQQLPDEEQEPFRERVRQGERLQENDLAAVRARLLAEGAIHPRRTRPPRGASVVESGKDQPGSGSAFPKPGASGQGSAVETAPEVSRAHGNSDPQGDVIRTLVPDGSIGADAGPGRVVGDAVQQRQPDANGGQIPFDPMPHPESGPLTLAAVLRALYADARPEVRSALACAVRGAGATHAIELQVMEEALQLAGAVLRAIAAAEAGDRAWIQSLMSTEIG